MGKQIQLFVLPFAGGNSMSFKKLEPFLDPRIEMVTVEYAGRLTRKNEKYIEEYGAFLSDVRDFIETKRKRALPYALFGYSLGSVLIYDLAAHGKMATAPQHVFVCAKGSLLTKNHSEDYSAYPQDVFSKEIVSLGGMNEQIVNNERFLDIFMEPVRKDFVIWGQYVFRPGKIPCDITAVYGKEDPETGDVADWRRLSAGNVDFVEMGGGHFFINRNWRMTAELINKKLVSYCR